MNAKNDLSSKNQVKVLISGRQPARFIYAPNYWQWFTHRINHATLPEEIRHCKTQLEVIAYLGLDVFSRNIYSNPYTGWFGGLSEEQFDGFEVIEKKYKDGFDRVIEKEYPTGKGSLTEVLRYMHRDSTLVQKKFLINDFNNQVPQLEAYISARSWAFRQERFEAIEAEVGDAGVVVAGELCSPLKMLHLTLGLADTTYFLVFHEEKAEELVAIHEAAQLDLLRQMLVGGVRVVMSMDNLDSMFHPPEHVEKYSASFYEKASTLCHRYGAKFFIHACGQQKANLSLISSLGVDGLEGVAYPPLGDVELDEAFSMVHDGFIITGGISAFETENLKTRQEVYSYVRQLFERMKPFANRFILAASCNTSINTSWQTLKHFRDAWLEFGAL
jgi:hypothetical protein